MITAEEFDRLAVAALRSSQTREAEVLTALLDAAEVGLPIPVRVELFTGATRTDCARLRRGLSALPVLYSGEESWAMLDQWVDRAGQAGQRFGFGDLLIGVLAAETGSLIGPSTPTSHGCAACVSSNSTSPERRPRRPTSEENRTDERENRSHRQARAEFFSALGPRPSPPSPASS
jgi:predicted nucleic acid-binding protein